MHRPFDKRIRTVEPGRLLGVEEDLPPETVGVVVRGAGAGTVGQKRGYLVDGGNMGLLCVAGARVAGRGPCVGPHSLKLLSKCEGCCVATERIVGWSAVPQPYEANVCLREMKNVWVHDALGGAVEYKKESRGMYADPVRCGWAERLMRKLWRIKNARHTW